MVKKVKPRLITYLKQIMFYALIVAPLLTLDVWLIAARSWPAAYVAEGFIIFGALMSMGPLQRRFWP